MQEEVDIVKEKYSALEEADNNYLDALQEAIDKQRKLREQENQYEDLATKQKKLSLMQRDTSGANQKEVQQLEKEVENLKLSINKERSTTIGMISQIARIFWGYDDDFNEEMHKIVANIDTNKSFLNQVDTLLALQSSLLVQSKKMHSFLGKLDQYLQDLSCSISKIESLLVFTFNA